MIKRFLATAALGLATLYAAPSYAGTGFAGYYLAQFTYPNGQFYHCFKLVPKNDPSSGYKFSGKWIDTDFPDTSGMYVVFKNTIHLAGTIGGTVPGYLAVDGKLSDGSTMGATFDYFTSSGTYIAAGSLKEIGDTGCKP